MHELSLCQNLLDQVTELARKHQAHSVACIRIQIGQLAGVEPLLLQSAFTIARVGSVAEFAEMMTEVVAPCVVCNACGSESEVTPSSLLCLACGGNDTRLIRGDELILARVELVVDD